MSQSPTWNTLIGGDCCQSGRNQVNASARYLRMPGHVIDKIGFAAIYGLNALLSSKLSVCIPTHGQRCRFRIAIQGAVWGDCKGSSTSMI
jgi:hypothetical protein